MKVWRRQRDREERLKHQLLFKKDKLVKLGWDWRSEELGFRGGNLG